MAESCDAASLSSEYTHSSLHYHHLSPRNPRHGALLPGVPGESVGDPAPAHTRAEDSSGAGGRPAVLAGATPRSSRGRAVTQHLCVFLLVLAEHLRHGDQGLDLGHLLADIHQLGQVTLADVVNCSQVTSRVTLILTSINLIFEDCSYLYSVFIWIRFVPHRRQVIQEDNHPFFVLEYERVHHLHVGLLAAKLDQICQILQTFCNHHQRPHRRWWHGIRQ